VTLEERVKRLAAELPGEERVHAAAAAGPLARFLSFLLEKNATMNLVSARSADPVALVGTHLLDALLGLPRLPHPRGRPIRLLDLGSGGGFPAIPLLLVRTDLEGTLVESSGKKAAYLDEAISRLALTARVVNARFPDSFPMGGNPPYDLVTTRAVASAGKLVRAARPLLSPDARALLWTSGPLVAAAVRASGAARFSFYRALDAERRGILSLECFT
jgi:16S rRNA (guanine527-N7)-methyltransferase